MFSDGFSAMGPLALSACEAPIQDRFKMMILPCNDLVAELLKSLLDIGDVDILPPGLFAFSRSLLVLLGCTWRQRHDYLYYSVPNAVGLAVLFPGTKDYGMIADQCRCLGILRWTTSCAKESLTLYNIGALLRDYESKQVPFECKFVELIGCFKERC